MSPIGKFLVVFGMLTTILAPSQTVGQTITEQKKVVAFLFGTVHPLNHDKTPMKDAKGHIVAVDAPLGTGFFVAYPDTRVGPNFEFVYLVTAKHVLRDFDGTFLPKVKVRLNLRKPNGDDEVEFVDDIPVTDGNGDLLWFHDKNNSADETVVLPLLPDEQKFDYKAIPTTMFVTEAQLKSDAVAEGDNLYFIGLLAQYFGYKRNYPVVRRGTLAMMTDEAILTPTGSKSYSSRNCKAGRATVGRPCFSISGASEAIH
jgi:hypothetical protein